MHKHQNYLQFSEDCEKKARTRVREEFRQGLELESVLEEPPQSEQQTLDELTM